MLGSLAKADDAMQNSWPRLGRAPKSVQCAGPQQRRSDTDHPCI